MKSEQNFESSHEFYLGKTGRANHEVLRNCTFNKKIKIFFTSSRVLITADD